MSRCRRTPKIIQGLREHFGDETEIVGFKLLSGVGEPELIEAATKQIKICKTDACVANDLQYLQDSRKLHLVEPGGEYTTINGNVHEVARQIAQLLPVAERSFAHVRG